MKFCHLHVHSHYSLLDGLTQIKDLVDFCKEDGASAIALTDHGSMYGVIEFYKACKKAGIKPIIGVEAYIAPGSRFDKVTIRGKKNYYHILLLAKNEVGYKNLLKLTTKGNLEGYYYKPRIDWELLKEHSEGIIATSACLGGEIPQLIIAGNDEKAKQRILDHKELFEKDSFYLEIQDRSEIEENALVTEKLIAFSKELDVPLVATNDAHYYKKEDDQAQDILLCLQNKRKKNETNRMSMLGGNFSLRSSHDMLETFKDTPEAISNTVKIAEMCNVEIILGDIHLPHFAVPEGHDGSSYLRHLCLEGMVTRYGKTYDEVDKVYQERLDYELSVIDNMGWPSYFLIVADFVVWAKEQNIVVGPGRGSAAGSLVSYLIGITNLCPIQYDLLFERFLNPERISMPDIDLDFADTRRGEVIEYVQKKYGEDKVAQIITFGTMAARAGIRDVGRVLDHPYDLCDKLAKMVPMFTNLTDALDTVPELKDVYKKEPAAKEILDFAMKLEGVARHASTHACGVLITKDPLTEYVSLQRASSSDNAIVSQYSLHPVEDLGLLKMDFLGLKNLTIIESAIKIVKNTKGIVIDIDEIPLGDKKTFELFAKGETTGVFQFECLSGDTIVSNTTIKKLYEHQNKKKLLSVYLNEGKVHKNEILQVVESGIKSVYALVSENDWMIKASADHKFLTADGWKKLSELKPGDEVLIKQKAKHSLYNICQNCDKQISGQKEGQSSFCYSCSAKHYSNPSKVKSRTDKIPDGFCFVKIKQIVSCGEEMTYDIAMRPPGNNFIANGFVVHNSSGMKRYLKELRPSEFEDIIAMVALYRPGPMEWIPDYIAGKHGKTPEVLHEKLEPILRTTYGVAIYQEQVMRMARDLAGFTMGEADVLRKAMGKKIVKLLNEQKVKFIEGCVKNGINTELAKKIFSFIEPFAGYGFNRSHAACYAMVAYQTAYLKNNWPTEFMAALLSADQGDSERVAIEIDECRRMGIEVKQPDINQSFGSFTVVTSGTEANQVVDAEQEECKTIRFGLKAIKNVGAHIADVIIEERKASGSYKDIEDLLSRVGDKDLNKKSLESLIKCGALDKFGDRGQFLANIESLLSFHKAINKDRNSDQGNLFGDDPTFNIAPQINLVKGAEISNAVRLGWEKELLGLYISEHPFSDYRHQLMNIATPLTRLTQRRDQEVDVAGIIASIKSILTRKNERMLFVKIEDGNDNVEVLVFPKLLNITADVWESGKAVIIQGTVSDKDNEIKILANKATPLSLENLPADLERFKHTTSIGGRRKGGDNFYQKKDSSIPIPPPPPPPPLKLIVNTAKITGETMNDLKYELEGNPGSSFVFLKIVNGDQSQIIRSDVKVNNSQKLVDIIKGKFAGIIEVA